MLQLRALLDLLEVRESLEGQAAYLAAERATDAHITTIREAADLVARDVARGRVYFRSNAEFHLSVARASQNRVLARSIQSLIGQVRDFRVKLMKQLVDMPERDVAEHAAITAAIAARQPEAARRTMVAHIRSFASLLGDGRSPRRRAEKA
jgi:GntR family transcriptional repressor for pyruvate dehydrogenase complex